MTSLNEILKQQRILQFMLDNFIFGIEQSQGDQQSLAEALNDYIQQWESNSCEIEAKINAYGHVIKKLESEQEYYRQQASYFADKAKAKKHKSEFLRSRVEKFLVGMPDKKFVTADFTLSIQKASIPRVIIDDQYEGDYPDEFVKHQLPSDYLDKAMIKSALKRGEILPFASLEYTESLRGI